MFRTLKSKCSAFARSRLCRDEKGVAAVEFALLLPLIFMLFVGTIEFSQAITVDRRVTQVTSATADLIARTKSTTTGQLDSIMGIVEQVMRPYEPNLLRLTVANIVSDPNDADDTTVCWVYHHNEGANTGITQGADFDLPAGIVQAGDSVLLAEASYDYDPLIFDYFIENVIQLTEKFYLKPRLSMTIEYNGNDCL
ncbi:MAG: TadE/TadG family type IV pilus assembly protein [Pseudomonadota bacterium]